MDRATREIFLSPAIDYVFQNGRNRAEAACLLIQSDTQFSQTTKALP
jgi:hypothetical protein